MTGELTGEIVRWKASLLPPDDPLDREAARALGFRSSPLRWVFGWTPSGGRSLDLRMLGYRPPRRGERSGEWAWWILWSLDLEDVPRRRTAEIVAETLDLRDRVRALLDENARLRATIDTLRRRGRRSAPRTRRRPRSRRR